MARRTFFTFHYKDVQRASIVRQSWRTQDRSDAGFFDNSLWEEADNKGTPALQRMIDDAIAGTTVTCVLSGDQTCHRPWVRYEIASSLLNGNGIVTVDIDQLLDWDRATLTKGRNPLDYVGLYKVGQQVYFAQWKQGRWERWGDAITSDLWVELPTSNHVVQLSSHCYRYDYVADNGYNNLGSWIEKAATDAGR